MDVSKSAEKIDTTVSKVIEYHDRIIFIRDKYVRKINKKLDELENMINDAIRYANSGSKWLNIKIKKILKDIQDILDKCIERIKEIISQIKEWYNKTMTDIKVSIITAVFAKLGQNISRDQAMPLADAIPHPDIESLLPSINIELNLPDLMNLGEIKEVKIPRIEI